MCFKNVKTINYFNKCYSNILKKYKRLIRNKANNKLLKQTVRRQKAKLICQKRKKYTDYIDNLEHVGENSKLFAKCILKKTKRIWNEGEKKLSQSIHFKSPACYKFLRDKLGFNLPSERSLNKWCPLKNLSPGIDLNLISNLKTVFEKMNENDKACVLLFDEIKIRTEIDYNKCIDEIIGLVDYGDRKELKAGSYICTFMVRGIFSNWKYPLSFVITENPISSNDLEDIIKRNLSVAKDLGLKICATSCDQGSSNRRVYSHFNVSTSYPYFMYENQKIYALYDVPHLIKSLRNNLLNYDLITPDGIVSWKVIKELYFHDNNKKTKLCPKLTKQHIWPNTFERMTVKLATQVFSRTVVAAIATLQELNAFKTVNAEVVESTKLFIQKIDKLFDILNSHSLYAKNPHGNALQKGCENSIFLTDMVEYLKKTKVISNVPNYCLSGMIQTISAVLLMTQSLLTQEKFFLITTRLNTDSLENLFGQIRSRCSTKNNISANEFSQYLSKIISSNMINTSPNNTNCEEDSSQFLSFSIIGTENTNPTTTSALIDENDNQCEPNNNKENSYEYDIECYIERNLSLIEQNSVRYIIGFTLFKLFKHINCEDCAVYMKDSTEKLALESEKFIFYKNYDKNSEVCFLAAPSNDFFQLSSIFVNCFEENFKKCVVIKNVIRTLEQLCMEQIKKFEKFKDYFNENDNCFSHRIKLLNILLNVLLKGKLKTLKRTLLQDKIKKKKVKLDSKTKASKKLKILKS